MVPEPSSWGAVRNVVLRLSPPIVTDLIRAARARSRRDRHETVRPEASHADTCAPLVEGGTASPPEWEVVENTNETWAKLSGWDHHSVAALQLEKWPSFLASVAGPGLMGRSHEGISGGADLASHNTIISFGYALARACGDAKFASVLDWGGGIGHYYIYAKALLPDVTFDYQIKDVPGLCDAGRRVLPEVGFHDCDDTALARSYDFVFTSSALHYARDPYTQMKRLCSVAKDRIFITRTPFFEKGSDVLVVQRPHRYGYMTEYAGWIMNFPGFVRFVEAEGFVLERRFLIGEQPYLPDLEEPGQYSGLLFRRAMR